MKAISPTSLKKSCELWGIPEKSPFFGNAQREVLAAKRTRHGPFLFYL
jgi:hypothetical protein